jgi:hypothetical protein
MRLHGVGIKTAHYEEAIGDRHRGLCGLFRALPTGGCGRVPRSLTYLKRWA